MILYHGTNVDFSEVDLKKSKPNKDFGQGFYLSREYAQAMDMAKTKVKYVNFSSLFLTLSNPKSTSLPFNV